MASGFALVLFQKKALMVTLLLILFAGVLHARRSGVPRNVLRWWCLKALAFLTVAYLVMVVVPVWNESSSKLDAPGPITAAELTSLLGDERAVHVAAYALLSPFTRTSISAFYYVDVFPAQHSFYGLDIGLDILGLGGMPDDNLVVWAAMYPNMPGGSVSAAYQFALYSQVGLGGALLGSALVGALLAVGWSYLMAPGRSALVSSVLGAFLLLFAVFLAIDSLRNSLISSYGLLWGVLLFGALWLAGMLARRSSRPHDSCSSRIEGL